MVFSARVSAAMLICVAAGVGGQTLRNRPAPAPQPELPPDAASQPLSKAADSSVPPSAYAAPLGTSLQIETAREYPMKNGEAIEGRLIHPLYVNGSLAV